MTAVLVRIMLYGGVFVSPHNTSFHSFVGYNQKLRTNPQNHIGTSQTWQLLSVASLCLRCMPLQMTHLGD